MITNAQPCHDIASSMSVTDAARGINRKYSRQRGSILMVSLWMLLILSLMAMGIGYPLINRLRTINYQIDDLHARGLVHAGIRLAAWQLNSTSQFNALSEGWARNPALFKEHKFADGVISIGYRTGMQQDSMVYGMIDEERKINLNTAPEAVLLRLPGITVTQVNALMDWRDADNGTRPDGAESSYYREIGKPYACKNGNLEFLDELLLVKSFDRATVDRLKSCVTVYGSGKVNINTAPADTLKMLGFSESLADIIVSFRSGTDGIQGTADDNIFKDMSQVNARLHEYRSLTLDETAQLASLSSLLTTSSTCYTIPIKVTLTGGTTRSILIVYEPRNQRIHRWSDETHLPSA